MVVASVLACHRIEAAVVIATVEAGKKQNQTVAVRAETLI